MMRALFSPPLVFVLWIGAAVAGWFGFWPWLAVPVGAAILYAADSSSRGAAFAGQPLSLGLVIALHGGRFVTRVLDSLLFFGLGYGLAWALG